MARTPIKMTAERRAEALRRRRGGETIQSLATEFEVAFGTMQRSLRRAEREQATALAEGNRQRQRDPAYRVSARPELSRRVTAPVQEPDEEAIVADSPHRGGDLSCRVTFAGERCWACDDDALVRLLGTVRFPLGTPIRPGHARSWLPFFIQALLQVPNFDWSGVLLPSSGNEGPGRRLVSIPGREQRLRAYVFRRCHNERDVRATLQRCFSDVRADLPGTQHLVPPFKRRPQDYRGKLVGSVTIGGEG